MTAPWILDTDPGIDDALAYAYLLGCDDVELLGLSCVFGNASVERTARNALQLRQMMGQQHWVAAGAAVPMVQPPRPPADFVHGVEGLGGVDLPRPTQAPSADAVERMIAEIRSAPKAVVLAAVGPLTNLALALDRAPDIVERVASVVIMGGTLDARGNVSPWAEANIWNDPHAAQRVLQAGWPVTLVGLDITLRIQLTEHDFEVLGASAPAGVLKAAAHSYIDFYRSQGFDGCQLHDPAAVIAQRLPALFEFETVGLDVVLEGERVGQVIRAPEQPRVRVAVGGDIAGIKAEFFRGACAGLGLAK
ncbi:nucleoside hydrolase [Litorivicinus lipolyticus]|uniref:Nucleoside hydrolase n=1 Tax=Litorivicinus lipolyticus TaxID=418701 RepID=A0A5Q2Q927_9GAMM|nr:nucleoside hydrolase [Litorivicinus lipolyticus]QGG79394.1 nucleoside hydrolase [Litorivicinus lipolyticus]